MADTQTSVPPTGTEGAPPTVADVFVVFGITGDLARVMTFLSLYRLELRGLLTCPIVGVAVDDWSREQLIERARSSIIATGESLDDEVFARFVDRLSYVQGDFSDTETYQRVATAVGGARRPVFYLEIPPFLFGTVVKGLAAVGLSTDARIVVEKPFGHDLASARALADELHQSVDESQLCRIDHYRGRWGSRRSSTSASRTPSWSRSGTGTTWSASRSRWPRASGSMVAGASTSLWVPCATWS
jgi:glucose-6-phosphate 1-dehydrogenase